MALSRHTSTFAVILFALVMALYIPVLHAGFIEIDDPLLVFNNPLIRAISPHTLRAIFTSYDPELYIPFTLFSYQLNYALGGNDPMIFHLTNVLLHAVNAVLVLFLCERLFRRRWLALAIALFFALHPIQVDTVAWIATRKDVLSTMFALGSMLMYLRARETRSRSAFLWSLILYACGLLSKVTILPLPALLLLFDWYEERVILRKSFWRDKIPFFAVGILFALIAVGGKTDTLAKTSPLMFLLVIPRSLLLYPWKILVPHHLSMQYPLYGPFTINSLAYGVPLLLILVSIPLVWRGRRWDRTVFCGILFYLLAIAPTLPQFAEGGGISAGTDHYGYFPSIGIFIAIAAAVAHIVKDWPIREKKIGAAAVLSLLALCSVLTYRQTLLWQNTLTYFTYVESLYPRSSLAPFCKGIYFARRREWPAAIEEYRRAAALDAAPNLMVQILSNWGAAEGQMGRTDAEIALYRQTLAIDPRFGPARVNLGLAYAAQGKHDDALREIRAALIDDPHNPDIRDALERVQAINPPERH